MAKRTLTNNKGAATIKTLVTHTLNNQLHHKEDMVGGNNRVAMKIDTVKRKQPATRAMVSLIWLVKSLWK